MFEIVVNLFCVMKMHTFSKRELDSFMLRKISLVALGGSFYVFYLMETSVTVLQLTCIASYIICRICKRIMEAS